MPSGKGSTRAQRRHDPGSREPDAFRALTGPEFHPNHHHKPAASGLSFSRPRKHERQRHRSPLCVAGGMCACGFLPPALPGAWRGCAPRLEHQGPGCALSTLARVLGFACGPHQPGLRPLTLNPPRTPPRSLARQTTRPTRRGRCGVQRAIAKRYRLPIRDGYLFASMTSKNA